MARERKPGQAGVSRSPRSVNALSEQIARLSGMHDSIAADVFPHGGWLVCTTCKTERAFSCSDAAAYLRNGWPRCCGYTMNTRRSETAQGDRVRKSEIAEPHAPKKPSAGVREERS